MIEDFGGFAPLNALVVSATAKSEEPDEDDRTNKKIIPTNAIADKANVSLDNQAEVSFFIVMVIDACGMF
jgi:hypothetical protein